MKTTKTDLEQIIKEEIENVLAEQENFDRDTGLPATVKGMAMVQKNGGERFEKVLKIIASSTPEKLMDALKQTKEGSAAFQRAKSYSKLGVDASGSDDKFMMNMGALDYAQSRS